MSTWVVHGTLIRVIDGDTVVADLDLGWKTWLRDVSIRLAGINAPELHADDEVTRTAARASRDALVLYEGAPITVTSHKLDKYGRVLANVVVDSNTDLSQLQLNSGRAVIYNP